MLGLLGVSQTSWFRDWLRRDIIVRAERLLDAKVSIARVGGDLFTGVVLDGVRLEQAGAPVITIDRVRVTYRVLTLRRTHIVLDSVDVLRPVVVARQTPDGWTFTRLVKPRVKPTGLAPIVFAIDALRIFDGRVLVEPLAPGSRRRVEDLDAAAGDLDRAVRRARRDAGRVDDAAGSRPAHRTRRRHRREARRRRVDHQHRARPAAQPPARRRQRARRRRRPPTWSSRSAPAPSPSTRWRG